MSDYAEPFSPSLAPFHETFGTFTPEAIVFDCDGVLLNTQSLWEDTQVEYLEARSLEMDEERRRWLVGRDVKDVVIAIAELTGEIPEEVGEALKKIYFAKLAEDIPVLPGAAELLKAASSRIPVAVASNSNRAPLVSELADVGLLPYVDHVVSLDDVPNPKPAPDIYVRACELLGVAPERTLAIEDSETGAQAASAAGCRLIVAPTIPGQNPEGELEIEAIGDAGLREWVATWPDRRKGYSPVYNALGLVRHEIPEAIVTDCDGLLLDTEALWTETQLKVLYDAGVSPTEEDLGALMGTTLEQTADILGEMTGQDPAHVRQLVTDDFQSRLGSSVPVMPGAREFLELASTKVPIAVASNSWHEILEKKLTGAGLLEYFESLQSASTVENPKPAPDMYEAGAKALGCEPSRCLAFEDSPIGARAAKAAGMTLIGIPSTGQPIDVADVTLSSLSDPDLLAWVKSWPNRKQD
ncbi:HAD family phosphatase [Dermabacter vaginalis]|uniref:HAD family hydrolase n=1 Tax=Dermabacter vaginalis TaxID=1630135 RepID=UPI00092BF63C|nr:HAD family phosphatase [Dermabacter vaginalis]MCG7443579.1 HAD family phosphatase [Dermabacter vaginalis]MCT2150330.1 HAD family phosphatase [Dermabacter vaginalis]SHW96431.1 haloacid dehalogenase superfamily enzyme, subfamily IA [Mycobacteroides abscessus subsp. abscessus]